MTETIAPVAKAVSRPRPRKPATVSMSALARHLDCSRTFVGKLEAEGVIQRHGDGFPLDQSRVAYIRHLRRERKLSPRGAADAELQIAKTEMLNLTIAEKRHTLVRRDLHNEQIDAFAGLVLTHLSGCLRALPVATLPCGGRRKVSSASCAPRSRRPAPRSPMRSASRRWPSRSVGKVAYRGRGCC